MREARAVLDRSRAQDLAVAGRGRRAAGPRQAWASSVTAAVLLLLASSAGAEPAAHPAAQALFEDARRLMRAGEYEIACAELESVRKLYAGPGVLLNLGDCYEKVGRMASARAVFEAAAVAASAAQRPDYEAEARRRQAALEPRLPRLAIRMPDRGAGADVALDGLPIDGVQPRGTPVDLGTHVVTARAAGQVVWSASVSITVPGETVTVQVPELHERPSMEGTRRAPAAAPSLSAPSPVWASTAPSADLSGRHGKGGSNARRAAGIAMVALGGLGIGVATGLALAAESRFAAAEGASGATRARDSDLALSLGNGASFALAVGVSLLANGAVLWLAAPDRSTAIGTNGQYLLVRGTF